MSAVSRRNILHATAWTVPVIAAAVAAPAASASDDYPPFTISTGTYPTYGIFTITNNSTRPATVIVGLVDTPVYIESVDAPGWDVVSDFGFPTLEVECSTTIGPRASSDAVLFTIRGGSEKSRLMWRVSSPGFPEQIFHTTLSWD